MTIVLKKGSSKTVLRKLLDELIKKKKSDGVDTKKYCGVISIDEDALILQKSLRDEWE